MILVFVGSVVHRIGTALNALNFILCVDPVNCCCYTRNSQRIFAFQYLFDLLDRLLRFMFAWLNRLKRGVSRAWTLPHFLFFPFQESTSRCVPASSMWPKILSKISQFSIFHFSMFSSELKRIFRLNFIRIHTKCVTKKLFSVKKAMRRFICKHSQQAMAQNDETVSSRESKTKFKFKCSLSA